MQWLQTWAFFSFLFLFLFLFSFFFFSSVLGDIFFVVVLISLSLFWPGVRIGRVLLQILSPLDVGDLESIPSPFSKKVCVGCELPLIGSPSKMKKGESNSTCFLGSIMFLSIMLTTLSFSRLPSGFRSFNFLGSSLGSSKSISGCTNLEVRGINQRARHFSQSNQAPTQAVPVSLSWQGLVNEEPPSSSGNQSPPG